MTFRPREDLAVPLLANIQKFANLIKCTFWTVTDAVAEPQRGRLTPMESGQGAADGLGTLGTLGTLGRAGGGVGPIRAIPAPGGRGRPAMTLGLADGRPCSIDRIINQSF
jgi:hypothetical protein